MKVKVRKYDKAPSLLFSERTLLKTLASNSPNLYNAVQKAIRGTSSEKTEPFLTEDICGRRHLKKTIFDRLNSLELNIEKGSFLINGEDFSKVDYFSLTFEHGEYHLSFRNNYFFDGEIKRSFKHEKD